MGDFLKPHWTKIILPALAICVFALLVSSVYEQAALLDRYTCDSVSLMEALSAIGVGDYLERGNGDIYLTRLNWTVDNETNMRWQRMGLEMENISRSQAGIPWHEIVPPQILDPLYPVPCETIGTKEAVERCYWYISEETHACLYRESPYLRRDESLTIPYRPVTPLLLAANAAYLFAFWYLASCLLVFIYAKAKTLIEGPKADCKDSGG